MKVISLNIGEKTTIKWRGRSVETGIFKFPIEGSLYLGEEDVANDNVIDRRVHGGINQALYGYSIEHYSYFKELYPNLNWQYGMFGENLTFSELNEEKINVGDIFQLGETTIEATKPRRPCFKLGIRFKDQSIIKQFMETTKSGIYFKVIKTGLVKLNDRLVLIEKSKDSKSIASIVLSKK